VGHTNRQRPAHNYCATCGSRQLETCRQCQRRTFCDACGMCNRHGEPRRRTPPTRQWVVRARWLLRRRGTWTPWAETRIAAHGPLGAITKGYRQLRTEHKPPRLQVVQHEVQVLPVVGSRSTTRSLVNQKRQLADA
jgi:hypothetical protein